MGAAVMTCLQKTGTGSLPKNVLATEINAPARDVAPCFESSEDGLSRLAVNLNERRSVTRSSLEKVFKISHSFGGLKSFG